MVKIPYGTSNFEKLITQGFSYIDRTQYIEVLESLGEQYIAYLRPRRFGKSLWVSTLQYYYGLEHKEKFTQLFGDQYIGQHPTDLANSFLVLKMDFSGIRTETLASTYQGFLSNIQKSADIFLSQYASYFDELDDQYVGAADSPDEVVKRLFQTVKKRNTGHKVYILIDEYDHFANELIAFHFQDYQDVVSRNGYVRKFYEAIKTATGDGIVDRIFITGVSPITLDSFTSGFNISRNLTTDLNLHQMMGFSSEEVESLMIGIGVPTPKLAEVMFDLKQWYNGYLFNEDAVSRLYNPDMVLYFALEYQKTKRYPKSLLDTNVASDYGKLHRMFRIGEQDEQHYEVIEELMLTSELSASLTHQYSFEKRFDRDDFISLLFYLGMITIKENQLDGLSFQRPNYVIGELYYDYFREIMLQRANLSSDHLRIRDRVIKLAQNNNPQPFVEVVEQVLTSLSNRDSIGFDEKYVKAIITSLLYTTGIYTIKSEYETEKKYVDLLLKERPPIKPNYTFALELKYLKKSEADRLEAVQQEGIAQLSMYLQHEELQQTTNLKAWLLVFVGTEAKVVVEVG